MSMGEANCLVCGKPLVYWEEARSVTCQVCGREETGHCVCEDGHYVCNECHRREGVEHILALCSGTQSKNPVHIMVEAMGHRSIYPNGPEHHTLVGAALLAAYANAGGGIELPRALEEMRSRSMCVPGGTCGFWGCCGAAVSVGMCVSIITETTPLSGKTWGLANMATARALDAIGRLGGPRCCKRDSFTAVIAAAGVFRESLGVELDMPQGIKCTFSAENKQCIKKACPYYCG